MFKTMLFPSLKKVEINLPDIVAVRATYNDDHCFVWLEGKSEPLELACQSWRIMQAYEQAMKVPG